MAWPRSGRFLSVHWLEFRVSLGAGRHHQICILEIYCCHLCAEEWTKWGDWLQGSWLGEYFSNSGNKRWQELGPGQKQRNWWEERDVRGHGEMSCRTFHPNSRIIFWRLTLGALRQEGANVVLCSWKKESLLFHLLLCSPAQHTDISMLLTGWQVWILMKFPNLLSFSHSWKQRAATSRSRGERILISSQEKKEQLKITFFFF